MKLTVVPENWLERLALWLNLAPTPISDTHVAFMKARTLMVATQAGIFEALTEGPALAVDIASQCNTFPAATHKLLNSLVHLGYLKYKDGRYTLTKISRKWMLQESKSSVYDKMMLQFVEWKLVEHYGAFLKNGHPADMHQVLDEEEWKLYQRGMRAMARISAPEVVRRMPVPHGATRLLDVGGSHGYYSVMMCRKHQQLYATIMDLPEAIAHAAPLLAEEDMGQRIEHWSGNVLKEDLGENVWDIIFISSLVHHFSAEQNEALALRVQRALKPGGYFVIQEYVRSEQPRIGDHLALLDYYFAATSKSGTWSETEMKSWQRKAGLKHSKTIWLRTIPRHAQIVGKKV